jgi:hypothetical protein
MELKDSERLIDSFKKQPGRTISAIVVLLLLVSMIAYFTGLFSEKGKRAAGQSKEGHPIEQTSKDLPHEQKKAEPRPTINQHTEGNQAPAVNVSPGGQSVINYNATKDKGKQE